MKLLRHILSHFYLVLFLVAVVSVFYYRTLLLPNNMVVEIDGFVNDIYPPALSFVSKRNYFWSIKGERIVSVDDLRLLAETDKANINTVTAGVADKNITVTVKNENDKDAEAELNIKADETTKVVIDEKDNLVVKNEVAPVAPASSLIDKSKKSAVGSHNREASSERELLISARTAFYQGKVMESEKHYRELTQLENDNPDTYGELGNVYYSQGNWDKAGQAYYEAAVRLIERGKLDQVVYLQRVIIGLNAEYAEKLAQHLAR